MSQTITKEELKASIDQVPSEHLEDLHRFIQSLAPVGSSTKVSGETFMEKMRKIKFEGPADFSENLDEYLYGGKTL